MKRIGFLWIVLFAIVVALGVPAAVSYLFTHPRREAISSTPAQLGLPYRDVAFRSRAGDVTLRGWFLPAAPAGDIASAPGDDASPPAAAGKAGDVTIVFAHGYSTNRAQKGTALQVARALVARGYNALLFDFRAHGESGGSRVTLGEQERHDLAAAVECARSLAAPGGPPPRVAVLGYSMGAATALLVAAEMREVEAVIADSPFADLVEYLQANLSYWTRLPRFLAPYLIGLHRLIYGVRPESVSPRAVVGRIAPRPILFIHGRADPAIPWTESEELFRLAGGPPNELFVVEGAAHVQAYDVAPHEYVDRVLGFLDRCFR